MIILFIVYPAAVFCSIREETGTGRYTYTGIYQVQNGQICIGIPIQLWNIMLHRMIYGYMQESIFYEPGRHEYHDAGGLNLSKSDFEKLIENSDGFDIM